MSPPTEQQTLISRMGRSMITIALLSGPALIPAVATAHPTTTYFEVLHAFNGTNGDKGADGLILDSGGNLYGETSTGGDLNCSYFSPYGCGVVFELNPSGKEKTLYKFTGPPDGVFGSRFGSLVRDLKENLYGVAFAGGGSSNCGIAFKVDSTGKETVLYTFTGTSGDGCTPWGNVILDKSGDLYGTTSAGGAAGYGTVFKIDQTGNESVVYSFQGVGSGDGSLPSGLVEDAAGNIFGVTVAGGVSCSYAQQGGCGTVFELTQSGKYKVLYSFTGVNGDGAVPLTTLTLDKNNDMYWYYHRRRLGR